MEAKACRSLVPRPSREQALDSLGTGLSLMLWKCSSCDASIPIVCRYYSRIHCGLCVCEDHFMDTCNDSATGWDLKIDIFNYMYMSVTMWQMSP